MSLQIYRGLFRVNFGGSVLVSLFLSSIVFISAAITAMAQTTCPELPFIRGLRVYGGNDERNLPIILRRGLSDDTLRYSFITIQFDVNEIAPPRLKIRFTHCNENWEPDLDPVYRDDFYSYSRSLYSLKAQTAAQQVTWRFINSFPSESHPFVRFLHSGNWLFDIVDEYDDNAVYAVGRFIVVDNLLRSQLSVFNDYWPDFAPPANRVHRMDLRLTVPPDGLISDYVTTGDFYKNHDLFHPYRVTSDRFESHTRFDGLGRRDKWFSYQNVIPGNGYRWIDFRNQTQYPTGYLVRRPEGPDVPRVILGIDRNILHGTSVTSTVGSWDADYLCVRFELHTPFIQDRDVFVAGIFNQWDPQPEDRMSYRTESGRYVLDKYLFRGFYEYQYITGNFNREVGYIDNANWTELEGSFWDTNNLYWCVVYYSDPMDGITRAVGFSQRYSGMP